MAYHNWLGKRGEQVAAEYLIGRDFQILERNKRIRGIEVDIIAKDGDELVFVEVKTRTDNLLSLDRLFSKAQRNRIISAANWYVQEREIDADVRFDVVFVTFSGKNYEVEHIEDAFHPQW